MTLAYNKLVLAMKHKCYFNNEKNIIKGNLTNNYKLNVIYNIFTIVNTDKSTNWNCEPLSASISADTAILELEKMEGVLKNTISKINCPFYMKNAWLQVSIQIIKWKKSSQIKDLTF